MEYKIRNSFEKLRDKTEQEVAKLDDRPGLSAREKQVYDNLKEEIKASEKTISKEIKKITD